MKFLLPLFFAVAIIGANSAYGYGEISTPDFKIVNSLGEEIKSPVIDQQLNLQTPLKNLSGKTIDWAYIVQIINSDRKSTRLNSSHSQISYAVFCLKKKKKEKLTTQTKCRTNISRSTKINDDVTRTS